jgi:sialic acid synthase SpsE
MLISYGKGVRTWERHIDIDYQGVAVSPYCTLPHQADEWFKAYKKAIEMCGGSSDSRRVISKKETKYLDALVRGVYAKKDIEPGYVITKNSFERDFYLAIPLHKGQLSCRELMNGETITRSLKANDQLTIEDIDGPYSANHSLKQLILDRGI